MRDKEVKIKKLGIAKYNFVKFNDFNYNQFFISSDKFFKVFDIRNNKEIENINEFKNANEVVNDSISYLISNNNLTSSISNTSNTNGISNISNLSNISNTNNINTLQLFSNKENNYKLIKTWDGINNISCISMNNLRLKYPEIMLLGTEFGDLYYSNINNISN